MIRRGGAVVFEGAAGRRGAVRARRGRGHLVEDRQLLDDLIHLARPLRPRALGGLLEDGRVGDLTGDEDGLALLAADALPQLRVGQAVARLALRAGGLNRHGARFLALKLAHGADEPAPSASEGHTVEGVAKSVGGQE